MVILLDSSVKDNKQLWSGDSSRKRGMNHPDWLTGWGKKESSLGTLVDRPAKQIIVQIGRRKRKEKEKDKSHDNANQFKLLVTGRIFGRWGKGGYARQV